MTKTAAYYNHDILSLACYQMHFPAQNVPKSTALPRPLARFREGPRETKRGKGQNKERAKGREDGGENVGGTREHVPMVRGG